MSITLAYQSNRKLRQDPTWSLLAADKAPAVLAVLATLFDEGRTTLLTSVLRERLERALEVIRAEGGDAPEVGAMALMTSWVEKGWLRRQYPDGASDEEYALTGDAMTALRFVDSLARPHLATTESRLATVMEQVRTLARDTDADRESRIRSLIAERDAITAEIERIDREGVEVLPPDRALERLREIVALAEGLTVDFHQYHGRIAELNREVRRNLLDSEASRREQFDAILTGYDVIGESEAGRTFKAFWQLLNDGAHEAALSEGLDAIVSRDFADKLDRREVRRLRSLTSTLLAEGSKFSSVRQQFASGLRTFVRSEEYKGHRRMSEMLTRARLAAVAIHEQLRPNQKLDFDLVLSTTSIDSISRKLLHDPALAMPTGEMARARPRPVDPETLQQLLENDEVDLEEVCQFLRQALDASVPGNYSQITIAGLVERFGTPQGLGTLVGYLALAPRHGVVTQGVETVEWPSERPHHVYRGTVPRIFFSRERLDGLPY